MMIGFQLVSMLLFLGRFALNYAENFAVVSSSITRKKIAKCYSSSCVIKRNSRGPRSELWGTFSFLTALRFGVAVGCISGIFEYITARN